MSDDGQCLQQDTRPVPPRKRPPIASQTETHVAPGPAVHLPAFLNYLESECGMARNTLAAYRTDLLQFFAWFERSGSGSVFKVDLKLLRAISIICIIASWHPPPWLGISFR